MPLGDTQRPPWGGSGEKFQSQNVLGIIRLILKGNLKKNELKIIKETHLPLGDTQRPPGGGTNENISNSKCARYHSHDPKRKKEKKNI